jgi:hypothetical protein
MPGHRIIALILHDTMAYTILVSRVTLHEIDIKRYNRFIQYNQR